MSFANTMRERWRPEWTENNRLGPMRGHFEKTLAALEAIAGKAAELAKNPHLSPLGRVDQLKAFAAKEVVPVAAKAARAVESNVRHLDARRHALLPSVREPNNVAAAILRSELRGYVAGKAAAERMKLLTDDSVDSRLLEAVLEAPHAVLGLADTEMASVMELYLHRHHAGDLALIEDEAEAINHVRATTRHLLAETKKAVMPDNHETAFNAWVEESAKAASVRNEPDAEIARMSVEAIKGDAGKLPIGERTSLIESLLAQNRAELGTAA